MEKAPRGYMRTFSMLSRLLKRLHTQIFGFLLIFSDLFSILIVLVVDFDFSRRLPFFVEVSCDVSRAWYLLRYQLPDEVEEPTLKMVKFLCLLAWELLNVILESLSSTFDTNTDTNNRSCACSLLARNMRTSVLEVTTTEVPCFGSREIEL